MKRITLMAALGVAATWMGVLAPAGMAAPRQGGGARPAAHELLAAPLERTPFETSYDAGEYYGSVKCRGEHVVSKKYPDGKDTETCETLEGTLAHMKAGKDQTEFENTGGGMVAGWDSDFNGEEAREFTYSVTGNLKKFRIVAIY